MHEESIAVLWCRVAQLPVAFGDLPDQNQKEQQRILATVEAKCHQVISNLLCEARWFDGI